MAPALASGPGRRVRTAPPQVQGGGRKEGQGGGLGMERVMTQALEGVWVGDATRARLELGEIRSSG